MGKTQSVDGCFIVAKLAWLVILCLVAYTTLLVVGYVLHTPLLANRRIAAPVVPGLYRFNNIILLAHILTALPALLIGPWQFLPSFRRRWIVLHRIMGKVYVLTILCSSVLGFGLASANRMGYVARAGFMTLAVFWFFTTWRAYVTIRRVDIGAHRRWMLRSYALTLATVTVRFMHAPFGLSHEVWYPIMTWVCWVPNLLVAEFYIQITDDYGRLHRLSRWFSVLRPSVG